MRGVDCSTSLQQGPVRVWGDMVSRDVRCTCRFMVTLCALSLAPISPASQPAESDSAAHWSVYFEKPNGDTYFFQEASSRADRGLMQVWRRIQFGASVMGAYSYQDLVEIDCSGGQEKILQVTFFLIGPGESPRWRQIHRKNLPGTYNLVIQPKPCSKGFVGHRMVRRRVPDIVSIPREIAVIEVCAGHAR